LMIYFQLSRTFCFVLHPQRHVYVQWRQRCFSPFLFEKKRLRQEFLGLAQGTSRNQTGGVDHDKDGDVDHVKGGDVDQVKDGDVDQVEGGDVRQVIC